MPERAYPLPVLKDGSPPWLSRALDADLAAVRLIARSAKPPLGRASAILMSRLGNGWIYPLLALAVFEVLGREALPAALIAGLNAVLLHCLYPYVKRRIGRPRPYHADPRLRSLLAVLDEHSFPSGHMMTLSGVLVPIVLVWPSAAPAAAVLLLAMAWSRIATAHHYPSDIVAGALLGGVLTCPLSFGLLAVW